MNYTISQLEAINTSNKNLLIITSLGSGKKHTMVGRGGNLIKNSVPPENILVATFSEKIVKELIIRVSNRLFQFNIVVEAKSQTTQQLTTVSNRTYKVLKGSDVM